MKIVKPKVEYWAQGENKFDHIAKCARVCYASDRTTNNEKFVNGLIHNNHLSMLRHWSIYFDFTDCVAGISLRVLREYFVNNPYCTCVYNNKNVYVSFKLSRSGSATGTATGPSARLRDADVGKAHTVHIVVRNAKMQDTTCQTKVTPTALGGDIAKAAFDLYCRHFPIGTQVRMLGVTVSGFDYHIEQLSLDSFLSGTKNTYEKRERAEDAIAKLRDKYGYASVQRGVVLEDNRLNGLDIRGKKEDTSSKPDNPVEDV